MYAYMYGMVHNKNELIEEYSKAAKFRDHWSKAYFNVSGGKLSMSQDRIVHF